MCHRRQIPRVWGTFFLVTIWLIKNVLNEHFTLHTFILWVSNFPYVLLSIQTFAGTLISCTSELKCEKRKSDHLLFQMLPPPVVKQLKQRRQVNCVTLQYFCFTTNYLKMKSTFSKTYTLFSSWDSNFFLHGVNTWYTCLHTYIHMYIHT